MQSRVIGLLTGHNTMRKYLYILDLMASPWYKSCRPEQETSAHILWECEALATLSHTYLGCSLMETEDVLNLSLGATGTLLKGQDSHDLISVSRRTKGLSKAHMHRDQTGSNPLSFLFYSILSLCTLNKESKEALTRDCIQKEQFHICVVFLVKIQWFHILFLPTPLHLLLILLLLISH